jgi:hypothetical protein
MTIERMQEALGTQPFRPFSIHLADGRRVPVLHREFAMSSPTGRTVVVFQPDDRMNIIDLLLVTDLEYEADSGKRSGKRKQNGR